jgi:hypothetical protein
MIGAVLQLSSAPGASCFPSHVFLCSENMVDIVMSRLIDVGIFIFDARNLLLNVFRTCDTSRFFL